jgi:phosphate uptake regulator
MTNQNQGGINPVAAAVAGAVVGAGVAVAGTMILEDKKNREKIKKVFNNAKNQAINYVEDMQKQVKDKKNEVKENLTEGKEKVNRVTKSVKKSLDRAVKDVKKAAK